TRQYIMVDPRPKDQQILIDPSIARPFLLDGFSDFLALEQGASPRTSEAYRRDVERLALYALTKGARTPTDISSRVLREFVYHLKDLGLAPASIRRNVSSVRTYFRFLLGDGHVVRDPSERLETPKRWRSLPDVLSVEEAARLLAAPSLDEPLTFRDRALLELAYGAGLRVSEWITLAVRDVLFDEGLVHVQPRSVSRRARSGRRGTPQRRHYRRRDWHDVTIGDRPVAGTLRTSASRYHRGRNSPLGQHHPDARRMSRPSSNRRSVRR